jgi:hypothetical protein
MIASVHWRTPGQFADSGRLVTPVGPDEVRAKEEVTTTRL